MTMWLLLSLLPNAGLFGSLFGTGEGDPSKPAEPDRPPLPTGVLPAPWDANSAQAAVARNACAVVLGSTTYDLSSLAGVTVSVPVEVEFFNGVNSQMNDVAKMQKTLKSEGRRLGVLDSVVNAMGELVHVEARLRVGICAEAQRPSLERRRGKGRGRVRRRSNDMGKGDRE